MTVRVHEHLDETAAGEVLALVAAAGEADGVGPLSERSLLALRHGGRDGVRLITLRDGGALAGYAHLDPARDGEPASGELVVHPAYRRRGHGRALAGELLGHEARIWAHGDLPAAAALAAALGLARTRGLMVMERPLAEPLPPVRLPEGVRLRAFEPGRDEDAWLEVNRRAFAHHPEQGTWTREDLAERETEPWFDPAGFFLAERGGELAGFHWTKIHSASVGEVYVIGIDPGRQGGGLGKALTLAGLRYLSERGLASVILYVEEDNTAATSLYTSLGFHRVAIDVMYARP